MHEGLRRQYLQNMGITVWQRRDRPDSVESTVETQNAPAQETAAEASPSEQWENKPSPSTSVEHQDETASGYDDYPEAGSSTPPPYEDIPPDWEPVTLPDEQREPPVSGLDWDGLRERVRNCHACGLRQGCTQTVFGVGNTQAELMVIGEAPGADEDRQGEPFVGRAGQLLNGMLLAMGFKREQVFIANILKCRPPNNRDPKPEEALKCEAFLLRQIALIQPRAILSVGRISAQNLLKTDIPVGKLRGRVHQYGETGIPLVVTYHPAYLLRSPEQKGKAWDDLQLALTLLGEHSS